MLDFRGVLWFSFRGNFLSVVLQTGFTFIPAVCRCLRQSDTRTPSTRSRWRYRGECKQCTVQYGRQTRGQMSYSSVSCNSTEHHSHCTDEGAEVQAQGSWGPKHPGPLTESWTSCPSVEAITQLWSVQGRLRYYILSHMVRPLQRDLFPFHSFTKSLPG